MKRRDMSEWQISNTRARKLRQKGVVVFYLSDFEAAKLKDELELGHTLRDNDFVVGFLVQTIKEIANV